MHVYEANYGFGKWWLRSPYDYTDYYARSVDHIGMVGLGDYVYNTNTGVAPALRIVL